MNVARLNLGARVAILAVFVLWPSARAGAEICVDVDLRFHGRQPADALLRSMMDEASSIWAPYGMRIQWASAASADRCASSQGSFDVLVSRRRLESVGTSASTLGLTRLVAAAIDHAPIYVDQEATELLLRRLTFEQVARALQHARVGPADVGRALGRVLAHELGHVLLAARGHQPRGLMRSSFVVEDLIRPQRDAYTLSPSEATRLRQRELQLTRH
jgi:hypothetical protein